MSRGRGMQMATGQDNDHRGFIDGRLNIEVKGLDTRCIWKKEVATKSW